MASAQQRDLRRSDRLPRDWRRKVSSYRGVTAAHFRRVMKTLARYNWMSIEERERAAYVIVEKEQLGDKIFEPED